MKSYSASQARAHLAEVLDCAESGSPVIIERNDVRFRVEVETPAPRSKRRRNLIEIVDPAVRAGQWTWEWDQGGLKFVPRPKRA